MLDREKPQIVVIGPRWVDAHKEMILACAERGIHMFCEKPMARDVAECDAIVAACERSHVKLAMAFQTRYGPRDECAKELIGSGVIGEVLEVRGGARKIAAAEARTCSCSVRTSWTSTATCSVRRRGVSACDRERPADHSSLGPRRRRGAGTLAGDRIEAMYGFARNPAIAHFATARPKEGSNRRYVMHVFGSKGVIELGFGWLPGNFLLADPAWTDATSQRTGRRSPAAGLGKPESLRDGGMVAANRLIVADLIHAVETDTQPRQRLRRPWRP